MKIFKRLKFVFYGYWRIPRGGYCYKMLKLMPPKKGMNLPYLKTRRCPYWDMIDEAPHQEDGYCHWLECSDAPVFDEDGKMIEGCGLLWDQVKECHIKEERWSDVWEHDIKYRLKKLFRSKKK